MTTGSLQIFLVLRFHFAFKGQAATKCCIVPIFCEWFIIKTVTGEGQGQAPTDMQPSEDRCDILIMLMLEEKKNAL